MEFELDVNVFGDIVKRGRIDRGWTQNQLAKAACISQAIITKVERGAGKCNLTTFDNICRALDIQVILRSKTNEF
jgi:ribosome-binding protein aMBF1 (putative translation factor)